jgi:hypothetical protein
MPPKAKAPAKAPTKAPAKGGKGDKALQSKSPAQFFADNKNIAGFDNVRFVPPSGRQMSALDVFHQYP